MTKRKAFFSVIFIFVLLSFKTTKAETASQVCQQLHHKIPAISLNACLEAKFSTIPLDSKQHKLPIIYKKIHSDSSQDKPRILVIGGIHSNELSSFSLSLVWTEMLLKQEEHRYDWLIAPAININALLKDKPTRQNVNLVDVNRNFPLSSSSIDNPLVLWERLGKNPRHYPGPEPFSEIETLKIDELVRTFKPQLIISIHAPLDLIDYDGLPHNAPQNLGTLPLDLTESFPGSLATYYWNIKRIPVLTIELADARNLPPVLKTRRIWYDMKLWLDKQYYPNSVPTNDITLFNHAMESLTLEDFDTAASLFSQIEDENLMLEAQNNLAYVLQLQNKSEEANHIWEQIIKNNPALTIIVKNHLIASGQQNIASAPQLLPISNDVLTQSSHLKEIRWRLNAWRDSWLNGEKNIYFSLYMPKKSPQQRYKYPQWKKLKEKMLAGKNYSLLQFENIKYKVIESDKKIQSTFEQFFRLGNQQKEFFRKKLIWENHQGRWKISQEIILK